MNVHGAKYSAPEVRAQLGAEAPAGQGATRAHGEPCNRGVTQAGRMDPRPDGHEIAGSCTQPGVRNRERAARKIGAPNRSLGRVGRFGAWCFINRLGVASWQHGRGGFGRSRSNTQDHAGTRHRGGLATCARAIAAIRRIYDDTNQDHGRPSTSQRITPSRPWNVEVSPAPVGFSS